MARGVPAAINRVRPRVIRQLAPPVAPGRAMSLLVPHLDTVVCHGGMNTVCEALCHGVPLVVVPIRHDQPINAARVVAVGAGIRVRVGHASPGELRAAVTEVLDDPGYRAAAARVGDSFQAADGARAAAERLAWLARARLRPRAVSA